MVKSQTEVTRRINAKKKIYPNGEVLLKKYNFTCYGVEEGYESVDDMDKFYKQYNQLGSNGYKETYSDFVDAYKAKKANRMRELQEAMDDTSRFDIITPISIVYIPEIVHLSDPVVDEERRRKKVLYNIAKTRDKIFDIASSNEFNYFITLTYDSKVVDRYSFSDCSKKVRQFCNNFGKRHMDTCPNFKYLLVHEQHKDGAYHYHGLVYIEDDSLLTYDHVRSRQYEQKHGKKLDIYNWSNWRNGFSTVSKIDNVEACRKYILKYISKNIDDDYVKGQRHFYYSQNCAKPVISTHYIEDDCMLALYDEIYSTDRSTGYRGNVDELNNAVAMIADYRYGVDLCQ